MEFICCRQKNMVGSNNNNNKKKNGWKAKKGMYEMFSCLYSLQHHFAKIKIKEITYIFI